MKFTIYTKNPNGYELDAERILANDVVLPFESHPHGMRLWVIGNEYGALGAVWASCEQDALDTLVDENLGDGLLIDEKYADDDTPRLGNSGETADLTNVWMDTAVFEPARDLKLLCRLAEARGGCWDNLEN